MKGAATVREREPAASARGPTRVRRAQLLCVRSAVSPNGWRHGRGQARNYREGAQGVGAAAAGADALEMTLRTWQAGGARPPWVAVWRR